MRWRGVSDGSCAESYANDSLSPPRRLASSEMARVWLRHIPKEDNLRPRPVTCKRPQHVWAAKIQSPLFIMFFEFRLEETPTTVHHDRGISPFGNRPAVVCLQYRPRFLAAESKDVLNRHLLC